MYKYTFSYTQPNTRLIDIEFRISNITGDTTTIQLPAWRPGRYEIGNFAKNIRDWAAFDSSGKQVWFYKTSKDTWIADTKGLKELVIKYNYYADKLDAGACKLDDIRMYVNPVHCCMYVPGMLDKPCEIELKVPDSYKVATALEFIGKNRFKAKNFDELVDCPFVASLQLVSESYQVNDLTFTVWFEGECKPDWKRILADFKTFTQAQIDAMGEFPVKNYHFLIFALPEKFHHGVEHLNNTVLAFGPSPLLMIGDTYKDFLSLASHELYHSWNVKALRPIEMQPYNYAKENYSRLGYVAEGVTTYMGDYFLAASGVYSPNEFIIEMSKNVQRHFDNYGRKRMSVGQASWDSWLDGYSPSIPHRKTNIYIEGSICALMLDLTIRHSTDNRADLSQVLRDLYNHFGKTNKGYTEEDYKHSAEKLAKADLTWFFNDYINGTKDYEGLLRQCLEYVGLELKRSEHSSYSDRVFGLKTNLSGTVLTAAVMAPDSPAELAGIAPGDEIIAVNNMRTDSDFNNWLEYYGEKGITLTTSSAKQLKSISLKKNDNTYYQQWSIVKKSDASPAAKAFFKSWVKKDF